MKDVSVLIVVDVNGALASGSLMHNAYLVDTNGFLGSWQEGTDALHTICQDGQVITWSVTAVSPSSSVAIASFSGDMIAADVSVPTLQEGSQAWSGRVESHGQFASFSYAVQLSLGGSVMSLNSSIKTV